MAELSYRLKARPEIIDALVLMCPNAPFSCNQNPVTGEYDYENVEWQTHPDWVPPTKEEVMEYLTTIQVEWDTNIKYSVSRKVSYPEVGEQLDALWHAMDQNVIPRIEPMYSNVKAVKDQFPKGDPTVAWVSSRDVNSTYTLPISEPTVVRDYDPDGF
jgi:hypothetical protein